MLSRIVEGYENYSVTDNGIVYNNVTGKQLKPSYRNGYLLVNLSKNNKAKCFLVHRLVALAFIPNTNNYPLIDHINTIRDDNRVENLRWCTNRQNSNNEISLRKNKENHYKRAVGLYNMLNRLIATYQSIKDAAKELGVAPAQISGVLSGYRPTCKGYKWQYV